MLKIKKKMWSVELIAFSYTKQVSVPFPCLCPGISCRKHANKRKEKEKKKEKETEWARSYPIKMASFILQLIFIFLSARAKFRIRNYSMSCERSVYRLPSSVFLGTTPHLLCSEPAPADPSGARRLSERSWGVSCGLHTDMSSFSLYRLSNWAMRKQKNMDS